mgnify:CR=1
MEPAVFRQPVDALAVLTSAKVPLFLEKSVGSRKGAVIFSPLLFLGHSAGAV